MAAVIGSRWRSAPVVKRVPVEAEGRDEDGAIVHILLHVDEGRPVELEFFREDAVTEKKRSRVHRILNWS
jgi:hypothetical protein